MSHNFHVQMCLYLLEFFVKSISGSRLARYNSYFLLPTFVQLNFLTIRDDSLAICAVDELFEPGSSDTAEEGADEETENINSGKSCIFALPKVDPNFKFSVDILVVKKPPKGMKELAEYVIGTGQLDLSYELKKVSVSNYDIEVDNCYPIQNENNIVGYVSLFLRLSSLGESVITEFNSPTNDESIFKTEEAEGLAYFCRVINSKSDLNQ